MTTIVDGKKIAEEILEGVRLRLSEIASYEQDPILGVVLVGKNPASLSYISIKQRTAEEIGLQVRVMKFSDDITEDELISAIQQLNQEPQVCGIIVQLPLPPGMNKQHVLDTVAPELDIDCLTSFNKQRLGSPEEPYFWPPAAQAVIKILEHYKVIDNNPSILIIGSGDLVGKPLGAIFRRRGIEFTMADSRTKELALLTKNADVIITGVGKANLITGDMIKTGAVVIDAGTAGSDEGTIVGDIERSSVEGKTAILSPVPGGVGPITVAMLLANFVKAALKKLKISP